MNINKLTWNIYILLEVNSIGWSTEGLSDNLALAPPILLGRNPGNEVGCRIHFRANDSNEWNLPFSKFVKSLETPGFGFWWTVCTEYLLPCPCMGLSYGTANHDCLGITWVTPQTAPRGGDRAETLKSIRLNSVELRRRAKPCKF